MRCFTHPTVEAVGLCKSCSRGLCRECVAEVGLSCSCRNRCEADVAMLNDLLERGRNAYRKTSASYFTTGLFTSLMGLAFTLLGAVALSGPRRTPIGYFLVIMGFLFLAWGIANFASAKRFQKKD